MLLLHYLVALTVLFPLTLLTSYLMATLAHHVAADFPYISDTGTFVPESCVFGQMLNMTALLFALIIYFRYLQVQEYVKTFDFQGLDRLNTICLVSGWISSFGISVVANFQETSVLLVHFIGAFGAFGFPVLFFFCDILIAYKTVPVVTSRRMVSFRVLILVLYVPTFCLMIAFANVASPMFNGISRFFWSQQDGGWEMHVSSAACEWALGVLVLFYMLSFYREFGHTHVFSPSVRLGPGLVSKNSEPVLSENHEATTKRTLRIEQSA